MKLVVVTAKQSTSVNLNDLENRIHNNPKGLLGIAIMRRMKMQTLLGSRLYL